MKKLLALLLASSFLISGCALEMKPITPKVVIGGGGGHCPPGQAKKGNC